MTVNCPACIGAWFEGMMKRLPIVALRTFPKRDRYPASVRNPSSFFAPSLPVGRSRRDRCATRDRDEAEHPAQARGEDVR
jgi:hypothetical protein